MKHTNPEKPREEWTDDDIWEEFIDGLEKN